MEPAPFTAASLFDPGAVAVVLAGTLVATLASSGWQSVKLAVRCVAKLVSPPFQAHANRASLARWAQALKTSGVLVAEETPPPDATFARAVTQLLRKGSWEAFRSVHDAAKAARIDTHRQAVAALEKAGELAPVFGLVGTLFAMTRIAPASQGDTIAATYGAIATAVLSSLYGVLMAHLVALPLAGAIARRSQNEEKARDQLAEWLHDEVCDLVPHSVPRAGIATLKPAA